MGCDIHMRAEVRVDGIWELLGRVFESDISSGPNVPATREALEMLTDGQLLEALAWEGRSLEQVRADREERVRSAHGRGVNDFRPFDPEKDDYHRAFRDALRPVARDALAGFYTQLNADRVAAAAAAERWRELCATREKDDADPWAPLPEGFTHAEHVEPVVRRLADERRDRVQLAPDVRAHIIEVAAAYRPYGDDDPISLSWQRGERDPHLVPEPYDGRNYNLFAMLAGVRNGGFRGEPRRIEPISEPCGIPNDASVAATEFLESYGVDGHSHSYFTLEELQAVDWDQTVNQWGILNERTFLALREGELPQCWSGWCYGDGVRMFTPDGYDEWVRRGRPYLPDARGRSWLDPEVYIDAPLVCALLADEDPRREPNDDPLRAGPGLEGAAAPDGQEPFGLVSGAISVRADATGQVVAEPERTPTVPTISPQIRGEWSAPWRSSAGAFVERTLPQLERVAADRGVGPTDIRIVFFFDN